MICSSRPPWFRKFFPIEGRMWNRCSSFSLVRRSNPAIPTGQRLHNHSSPPQPAVSTIGPNCPSVGWRNSLPTRRLLEFGGGVSYVKIFSPKDSVWDRFVFLIATEHGTTWPKWAKPASNDRRSNDHLRAWIWITSVTERNRTESVFMFTIPIDFDSVQGKPRFGMISRLRIGSTNFIWITSAIESRIWTLHRITIDRSDEHENVFDSICPSRGEDALIAFV
jgi:hypothetical protein